jgi:TatD DNase family protein
VSTVLDLHAYLGEFDPFGLKPLADGWEAAGVGWIVAVGDDIPTSEAAVDAAWSLPNTIAGVGLHPSRLPANGGSVADDLEEVASLAELATDPQVAVITDVGIDVDAEAPRELQEAVLRRAIEVAADNSRSILLVWNDDFDGLVGLWASLDRPPHAALLGFTGTAAQAGQLLECGFYFSLSPESVGLVGDGALADDVLAQLPADRLFVHSNTRNGGEVQPPVVRDVVVRLAQVRAVDAGELGAQINENLWVFLAWRPK